LERQRWNDPLTVPRYRWPEPIDGLSGWQGWELHQATGFKLGWLLRPEERAGEIWPKKLMAST
ncbi:MAG: hypothetical protein ACKOPS_15050, partial [Cyanobium sp.]